MASRQADDLYVRARRRGAWARQYCVRGDFFNFNFLKINAYVAWKNMLVYAGYGSSRSACSHMHAFQTPNKVLLASKGSSSSSNSK